jgi:uncharacterized protein YbdZ (MbtH family)
MTTSESADERYIVVVNHEEQYSIWPEGRDLPLGWHAEGTAGPKDVCLDHIQKIWTDMRPLSLRKKMEEEARRQKQEQEASVPATASDDDDVEPLVRRLAAGSHPVVVTGVGDRNGAEAIERFRQRVDRGQINVLFPETQGGTELSLRFDPQGLDRSRCDFARRSGNLALAGDLNLDGVDVRCEVDLSLAELAGTGRLVLLS